MAEPAWPVQSMRICDQVDEDGWRRRGEQSQAALNRLLEIFRTGDGDPAGDAAAAAAAGDFRLIWSASMAGHGVIGAHCRFPEYHPISHLQPLLLTTRAYSDGIVLGECDTDPRPVHCVTNPRMDAYAPIYNQAIIAHPAFPYADLCEPPRTVLRSDRPNPARPQTLAAPRRVLTEFPRNIGEAARRGTPAAVRDLIRSSSREMIDRPDDFGLTPLAWAVIEQRDDIARMLMAAGADPLAGCRSAWARIEPLPITLALVTRQHRLVDSMLTASVIERVTPWSPALVETAVRGDHARLVRRMLSEPHRDLSTSWLMLRALESGSETTLRAIIEQSSDAGPALLEAALNRGDPAQVQRALQMRPPLGPGRNPNQSPLGMAVQRLDPDVDDIVELLLDAGAAPDSPAQWGEAMGTSSAPATALAALVIHASWSTQDQREIGPADLKLDAAQRRALELLLARGASIRAAAYDGRPLAVLLATGRYDPRRTTSGLGVRPGWITRLVRAGMDVNTTWLGSTALDWLDSMGMAETPMAREFERLGGRRVRPAPARG